MHHRNYTRILNLLQNPNPLGLILYREGLLIWSLIYEGSLSILDICSLCPGCSACIVWYIIWQPPYIQRFGRPLRLLNTDKVDVFQHSSERFLHLPDPMCHNNLSIMSVNTQNFGIVATNNFDSPRKTEK